jgi:cytochrome c-type biogenesis protein
MFVALGMTATGLGSTLRDHQQLLDKIAGSLIVAMGVFFLLTPFVPRLNREWRPESLIARAGSGGPVVAGLAFAVAWTPCVGPTLASILAAASTSATVGHGGVLLAFYSAGLAVPFLVTAVAFDRATAAFRWLRDHYVIVTAVSGLILIGMGVLILSGELTRLNVQAQHLLQRLHLDFLYSL